MIAAFTTLPIPLALMPLFFRRRKILAVRYACAVSRPLDGHGHYFGISHGEKR